MKVCALCDSTIDASNNSQEHLILNAIGGRKKVPDVLCIACNGGAGERWDSVLAKQLNAFSTLAGVKRERRKAPSHVFTTSKSDKLRMEHDGNLSLQGLKFEKRPRDDGRFQITMTARTMTEARKKLTELSAKHPEIDVEKELRNAEIRTTFPGPVIFTEQIGGLDAGRSIVKSALCLAVANGVEPRTCVEARDYLKRDEAEPSFGYYFERDLVLNRPAEVALHCIAVSSRECEGQLLGYVEYFGIYRMVVCLAQSYNGPDIHVSYAVDPVAGKELHLDFELNLSRSDIKAIYAYERVPNEARLAAMHQVMPKIVRENQQRAREHAHKQAFDFALTNCGAVKGEAFTEEQLKVFFSLYAKRLMDFLHQRDFVDRP